MDKLFKLFVCLGLLAGGVGFTQTYEVYNKFGSDGIYEIQDDGQKLGENASGFGGLYNIAFGLKNINEPKETVDYEAKNAARLMEILKYASVCGPG